MPNDLRLLRGVRRQPRSHQTEDRARLLPGKRPVSSKRLLGAARTAKARAVQADNDAYVDRGEGQQQRQDFNEHNKGSTGNPDQAENRDVETQQQDQHARR